MEGKLHLVGYRHARAHLGKTSERPHRFGTFREAMRCRQIGEPQKMRQHLVYAERRNEPRRRDSALRNDVDTRLKMAGVRIADCLNWVFETEDDPNQTAKRR